MIFKQVTTRYDDELVFDGRANVVLRLINYVTNEHKTMGEFIGYRGFANFDKGSMERSFYATQMLYNKIDGDKLVHLILSFSWDLSIDEDLAMRIANVVADTIGKEHQVIFGVHVNGLDPHIHFIINPVSYINGKEYIFNSTKVKIYGRAIKDAVAEIAPDTFIEGCTYVL